jgi:SAM-dependent methyltransferase
MHREPFYRDYKARVRAILAPRPGGLYLDLGMGAGTDALAAGARVIGLDRSLTMCREARARGLTLAALADAAALPLPSNLVDGCWSDRTFQHLEAPDRALRELVRVLKPGALLVLADPDYGTQSMDFPDQALAQRVLDFRTRHLLRNGALAHGVGQRLADAGLDDVAVEERRLVASDPDSLDHVLGLRSWAGTALGRGMMSEADVQRWEALYDEVVAAGRFRWEVSFFITSGRKAAG